MRGWKGELVGTFGRFTVHVSLLFRQASFNLEGTSGGRENSGRELTSLIPLYSLLWSGGIKAGDARGEGERCIISTT